MPTPRAPRRQTTRTSDDSPSIEEHTRTIVAWLERTGTKRGRDGMARYGLPSTHAFGIGVGVLQQRARKIGRHHDLATALWETGWYEARLLAAFLGEPLRVTSAQMDAWCRDFDNWGVCDTVCFHLWDRAPHAWKKVAPWSRRSEEFVRRGGFALLACLALHDKQATDDQFLDCLPLIEAASTDDRNFVKKGVNWALRAIGTRNAALRSATVDLSGFLASSPDRTARWIGADALRKLTRPARAVTPR